MSAPPLSTSSRTKETDSSPPDDHAETGGELLSSIPELYFDILARIVPGGMLVWLYGYKYLSENTTAFTSVLALLSAYLIGAVLHVASEPVGLLTRLLRWITWFKVIDDGELWKWIRSNTADWQRKRLTKLMAEKLMFRSALLVPVIFLFHAPSSLPAPLLEICAGHPRKLAIIVMIIFFWCMLTFGRWIGLNKDQTDIATNERHPHS